MTPAPASSAPGKSIVLTGMMGSGKTAFGRALAQRLHLPFLDADHEIEARAGCSIPAFFAAKGEAAFRALEKEVIAGLLAGPRAVIATGGGAVLDADTRRRIREQAVAVWLQADIDILYTRVRGDSNRPLLKAPNPRERLAELLAARAAHYAEAPVQIRTDEHSFAQTLDKIAEAVDAAMPRS